MAYSLGGSSMEAVWSFFMRLSMILSVINLSFPSASLRTSGLSPLVTVAC
jgi:hypothetical protein